VFSVLSIELTLAWNSISDVYTIKTTGELIPFVIGVCGVWQVFDEITKGKQRKAWAAEALVNEAQDQAQAQAQSTRP